jgi:hypothetical protein
MLDPMNAARELLARLEPAQAQAIKQPTLQQIDSAVAEGIKAAHEFESAARQQTRIDPRVRFAR